METTRDNLKINLKKKHIQTTTTKNSNKQKQNGIDKNNVCNKCFL